MALSIIPHAGTRSLAFSTTLTFLLPTTPVTTEATTEATTAVDHSSSITSDTANTDTFIVSTIFIISTYPTLPTSDGVESISPSPTQSSASSGSRSNTVDSISGTIGGLVFMIALAICIRHFFLRRRHPEGVTFVTTEMSQDRMGMSLPGSDANVDDRGEIKGRKIAAQTSTRRLSQLVTLSEPASAPRPVNDEAVKSAQDLQELVTITQQGMVTSDPSPPEATDFISRADLNQPQLTTEGGSKAKSLQFQ